MNWKTTTAGAVAAISALVEFVAAVPPELQNQVPMLFPEQYRGTIAAWCQFTFSISIFAIAYFAKDKPKV
jgi:hypothetical protein